MKRFGKKALSVFLAVLMLISVLSVSFVAFADVTVTDRGSTFLVVPETIYLKPSTGNATEAQYFVNNTLSDETVSTVAEAAQGTGTMYIKIPDAKSVKIDVYDWNDAKLSYASNQTLDENGYVKVNIATSAFTLSTGVAAGSVNYIKWHFTATMRDNTTQEYDTWSAVYSPYYTPIGVGMRIASSYTSYTKVYNQTLAWVSGVHGYDSTYQFNTNGGGDCNKEKCGFYYANSSGKNLTPLLGAIGTDNGTVGSKDWLSNSATDNKNATFVYANLENSNWEAEVLRNSYYSLLNVDTSRYTKFNQIPNLTFGFMQTDREGANNLTYYAVDHTGTKQENADATYNKNYGPTDSHVYQWRGRGTGTYLLTESTVAASNINGDSTILYNKAWDKQIDSSSKLYSVKFGSYALGTHNFNNKSHKYCQSIIHLNVTAVNKKDLRNEVVKCMKAGYQSSWANSGWDDYQTALKTACQTLGNPLADADAIKTAKETLTAKFDAVKIKSISSLEALHRGYVRVLDELGNTTGYKVYAQIEKETESSVSASTIVDMTANSYDNYQTCIGYIDTANAPAVGAAIDESSIVKQTSRHFSAAANAVNTTFFYKAKDINVTIAPNGGTWNDKTFDSTIVASIHSTFTPKAPTRVGYTFAGWSVTAGNSALINDNLTCTCGTSNTTITAQWTPIEYTLSFDVNKPAQGSAPETPANQTVTYDAAVGTLPVVAVDGYDFAGWYTAAQDGNRIETSTLYNWTADNATLFAHWVTHGYAVTFDTNGGDTIADMPYDTESGTLPGAVRRGYSFAGWTVTAAEGNWTVGDEVAAGASLVGKYGNVTLKANWTANTYNVTFDLNDGDRVGNAVLANKTMTATFDSVLGSLPNPTFTAYEFLGWFTEPNGGAQVTADTLCMFDSDVTYYAHWKPITYTVTLVPKGGTIDGMEDDAQKTISYTIESTFTFPSVERGGYTFEYWSPISTAGNWRDTDRYSSDEQFSQKYGNVRIEVKWSDNAYVVHFDLNDTDRLMIAECDTEEKLVHFDSAVGELPVPTMTAYEFLGWYDDSVYGTKYTADTSYEEMDDITLYAHWAPIQYHVTYETSGGNAIEDTTYTIEDDLALNAAEKTGYIFSQWIIWSTEDESSWTQGSDIAADALKRGTGNYGNVTLYAFYTDRYYKITWVINGSETTVDVKYNAIPQHAAPVIDDDPRYTYTFTGWEPAVVRVTEDATYVAQFQIDPKVYTLRWLDADGSVLYSDPVAYGTAISAKPVPTKAGYTSAWANMPETMPAADCDIVVSYQAIPYTVTWLNWDGSVLETDTAYYDSIPRYDGAEPTKAADSKYTYIFNGWSPVPSPIKGDVTYTAVYRNEPKTYTVTWQLYDAINPSQIVATYTSSARYGEAITDIPSIPKVHGYAGEWNNIPDTMPDHDITITGGYIDGARTVTWVIDTDKTVETVVMDGNKPVYTFGTPKKPATAEYVYTFKGWSSTPNGVVLGTLPTVNGSDISLYAVYDREAVSYTVKWIADGTVIAEQTVPFGSNVPTVAVPEKTGHTGVWDYNGTTMPAHDLVINAVYTPIKYNVSWIIGESVVDSEWDFGTVPVFSGTPMMDSTVTDDFVFVGWDKEITAVEGNAVYTAVFDAIPRKYLVTYIADGVTIKNQYVAYGLAIELIDVPVKEGYDGEWDGVPDTMPAENIVIRAKYIAKEFVITWITPDGVVTTTAAYDSIPSFGDEDPVKAPTADKEFTFIGWAPEVTKVTGYAIYTAQFKETNRKYTATFVADGQVVETRQIAYGDLISKPDVPEKEGYTGDWSTPYRTMPMQDITIEATYTARKYTVLWKAGGLTIYSATVAYGQFIPEKEVPEKAGHTGAWDTDLMVMPAHSLIINAVYTVNTYEVKWHVGGDTGSAKVTYGEDFEYSFAGDLPDAIRVTIKGKPATNFTYNKNIGSVFIPGNAIVGDVYITERAADGYNNIYIKISNGGSSNTAEVIKDGMAYHTQIYAPDGYLLPEEIEVYLDGVLVTKGYTYSCESGKLTINAEIMNGELEIKGTCPVDPNYVPPSEEPDDPGSGKHGGLFGWLYDFFESLARFFRRIFGIKG